MTRRLLDAVHAELQSSVSWPIRLLSNSTLTNRRLRVVRAIEVFLAKRVGRNAKRQFVPGGVGQPEVEVLLIDKRTDKKPSPAVLHIHGGGYVAGRAGFQVPMLEELSRELSCLVISVEYRLAPETSYEGSREDNYAALRWLHRNAEALKVDPSRIAVVGESAGGGHAAALAILARNRGEVPLCFQVLIYPMLDDRTVLRPDDKSFLVWNRQFNEFGWRSLLRCQPGSDDVPAGVVPGREEDLSGLPPAWLGVGDQDLFLEEDLAYAERLRRAEVPVELVVQPGAFHGFDLLAKKASVSRDFTRSWQAALHRVFSI
jgi:acetyl esterase/lipase